MKRALPSNNRLIGCILLALVVVAFAVRLGAVIGLVGISTPPVSSDDAKEYDTYAWNLAQGRGFRGMSPDVKDQDHLTAYRAPFPSFYYAAIYRVFGHSYPAAHVANSLLGALTLVIVYLIGARCFSRRAGLIAAALWSVYPISIYYNLSLLSEVVSTFLLCAFVFCALKIKEAGGLRWSIAAGLLFGAVLLSKPGYVFAIPLLFVWGLIIARGDRRVLLRTGAIVMMAVLTVVPWALRNKIVMGSTIPFSTGGGSLLLQANNRIVVEDPMYYGYAVWDTYIPEYAGPLKAVNDEIKRDALAKSFGTEWLRENTDKWAYLLRGKMLRMWTPHYYGAKYSILRPLVLIYYGVILILFLAVLLPVTRAMYRRGDPVLIIHVLIIATTATALVFHGQHRYRFPIDPLLFCFAGAGLAWLTAAFSDRSLIRPYSDSVRVMWRKPMAVLAAGAIVAFCVWTNSDNARIENFRTRVCGERIHKIQLAWQAYRRKHNRPPESIESLVPEHLENLQALHCPIHSLDYCDYELMGSSDTTIGKKVISYRLVHDPTNSESFTVAHESLRRAHPAREKNHIRMVDLVIEQTVLAESAFRLVKGAQ